VIGRGELKVENPAELRGRHSVLPEVEIDTADTERAIMSPFIFLLAAELRDNVPWLVRVCLVALFPCPSASGSSIYPGLAGSTMRLLVSKDMVQVNDTWTRYGLRLLKHSRLISLFLVRILVVQFYGLQNNTKSFGKAILMYQLRWTPNASYYTCEDLALFFNDPITNRNTGPQVMSSAA
jgi:hypothetical protein